MAVQLTTAALAISAPVITMIGGGIIASFKPPGATIRSAIQHFAAGLVFYIVAAELLPGAVHASPGHAPNALLIGVAFAVGAATMFALRRLTTKSPGTGTAATPPAPANTAGAAAPPAAPPAAPGGIGVPELAGQAVEALFDGLLLGLGLAAGSRIGVLLAVALSLEHLSLGLVEAVDLQKRGISRALTIAITTGLSLAIVVGAVAGATALRGLSGNPLAIGMAFASAAVLFLVTEELLVEAHEGGVTNWGTSMFFAGFLALLMLDLVTPK